jgi:glycosyltransferase involved in cell wall biosynthesis
MGHEKKRILVHLPIPISPDKLNGTNGRVLGMLKYFHDRRDQFSVDAIAGNKFGNKGHDVTDPEWTESCQQELLKFVDNIFVYRGENNWFDFVYTRSQSFYHQKLLRQQLPVDSDYFAPPGYVSFMKKLLAQKAYDFIWINNLDYAHLASNLRSPAIQTVIDIHDITSRFRLVRKKIAYSKDLKFDYQANFAREINLLDRFGKVIVDSQYERDVLAQRLPPDKLYFIPSQVSGLDNGANSIPYENRSFDYDVLFVGSDNQPNREGLEFFLGSVLPLIVAQKPNVRISIAGRISSAIEIDKALTKNITCLGYIPDLAELYLKSRLVICPLRIGSGTKFKLVEAMAYAMPIVTTVHCASALSLVDGINAFIADDPDIYAKQVLRLIDDTELAGKFSQQIATTFATQHASSAIYSKLDAIFGGASIAALVNLEN